jgi:hypothetical protein
MDRYDGQIYIHANMLMHCSTINVRNMCNVCKVWKKCDYNLPCGELSELQNTLNAIL